MAFKKKAIAKEVQSKINSFPELPKNASMTGLGLYELDGSPSGLGWILRGEADDPSKYSYVRSLQQELLDSPNFTGISYRGVYVPSNKSPVSESQKYGIANGRGYYDSSFMATTPSPSYAKTYGDNFFLEVLGNSGKKLLRHADEGGEVLYPAGNQFDVENYRVEDGKVSARLVDRNLAPEEVVKLKKQAFDRADFGSLFSGSNPIDKTFQQSYTLGSQGFESGQKFVSPNGGIASLIDASDPESMFFQTVDGKSVYVNRNQFDRLQIKSPADLQDLKRGDGLIANKSDQRYTVMGATDDAIQVRGEDGVIKTARRSQVPELFRPNSLGFGTFPAITSGLLGTAGIVGGATAAKLLAKSLGANEDQQNIAAGVGGAIGGLTGVTTGYIGEGATMPKSFQEMAKRAIGVKSNSEAGMATSNKKINTSISTSIAESNRPKLTSDIIADYLDRMGGQATLVKTDGSQYNPDRKGRVNVGDRMTTAEKFGQAGDIGLNNDFTKLPEVHARFDDRRTALQVQKEIATGRLTTQKFFDAPSKEIANQAADEIRRSPELLGKGESVEVRPAGKGFEVVAVKEYQPIPSRGNTLARTYGLNNDPTGSYVAFNKPEEAYKAPKSLKELQREARSQQFQLDSAYKELNVSPDMSKRDYLSAIKPRMAELEANEPLRQQAKLVLDDIVSRVPAAPDPQSSQLTQYVKQAAIASEPQQLLNSARDTGGWANAVGESYDVSRSQPEPTFKNLEPRFRAEMGNFLNPTGLSDRAAYDRAKTGYEGYQDLGYAPKDKSFPDFYDLQRQSKAEGVRPEAFQNYIKGKQNAPLIEAGVITPPELPMTARLGQEYISPKTGNVGTVESVGKKGVKLNVDGQVVPVEYQTLEKLKYTGNKGYGFSTPAALRPVLGGFIGGTVGSTVFKQIAQAAGLNEDQQNAAAATGGLIGSFSGSALTNLRGDTNLRLPTPQEFAKTMMSAPQQRSAGARLFDLASSESGALSIEQRQKAADFNQQYESGAIAKESYSNKRSPMQKLALDESAAIMGMSPDEYRKFQDRAYKEFPVKTELPKGSGKPPKYVEPARFSTDPKTGDRYDMQSFREANTEWRRSTDEATKPLREAYDQAIKSGDKELQKAAIEAMDEIKVNLPPAPVKSDFIAPLQKPVKASDRKMFDMGAMSESAMDSRRSQRVQGDAPMTGYQRKFGLLDEATGEIVKPKSGFQQLLDNVTDTVFQPKKSSGGFAKSAPSAPKSSNFIAESTVEAAAKSKPVTLSTFFTLDEQRKIGAMSRQEKDAFYKSNSNYRAAVDAEARAESDMYRSMREREAARGLEQPQGKFDPISKAVLDREAKAAEQLKIRDSYDTNPSYRSMVDSEFEAFSRSSKTQPKQSNFIAESTVEAAAKSSGATTAQVKAQIANQRSTGAAPDLAKATEAIATAKQRRSLQGVTLPEPIMQLSGLAEPKPFNNEVGKQAAFERSNLVFEQNVSQPRSLRQLQQSTRSPQQFTFNPPMPETQISTRAKTPTYDLPAADFVPLKNPNTIIDRKINQIDSALKAPVGGKIGDRIGASGLGAFMDTAQAAQVLTESASRGENAPTALTRAGLSVGAGYATTALASFIPNPYLRTAAQLGGGIAAVVGADKAIDQVVGRNEAKEQKYAKDLSKLDLQATDEKEQWKPFANDSNIAAAYGNSLTAQIQQNLDYRPAARSLANLANRDAIENARYQSERQTSIQTGMDAKSGKKTIAYEDRGNGVTVGYMRNRGYNATESRVLALQNLASESGYEVPRTGKFDGKTLDALEKIGYSQKQISEYIQGDRTMLGSPAAKDKSNQVNPNRQTSARTTTPKVTGQQLSAALSAERQKQGLSGSQVLDQGTVDSVFRSLAGKSLTDLRRTTKVGGASTQRVLRAGVGLR